MKATKKTLEERVIAYAIKRNMGSDWVIKAIKENVNYFGYLTPVKAYEACLNCI